MRFWCVDSIRTALKEMIGSSSGACGPIVVLDGMVLLIPETDIPGGPGRSLQTLSRVATGAPACENPSGR